MRGRVLELAAPGKVVITDVDVPTVAGDQILIRSLYSGISTGTELLAYRGEIDPETPLDETIDSLSGAFSFPFRYGYSCVGRVAESGTDVATGSLVFAFHPHQDLFVVPSSAVIPLPELDPRIATMFPLVETALQISLDAGAVGEQAIIVTGLGPVGILVAALLQRAGAAVVGVEPRGWRRAMAEALGIETVDGRNAKKTVLERTRGRGVDLVVEVSGNPDALDSSLELLRHEGTALVASWYGARPVRLALGADFHRRRLTIRSTQVSTIPAHLSAAWTPERRRAVALRLMDELPLKRLATHEFAFDRAGDAFAALDRGDNGLMHAALRYDAFRP